MMRKLILVLLLLGVAKLHAQEQQNIADLDALYQAIQLTPSYKAQLKNDYSYRKLYENLRKDLKSSDDFVVYQQLLKLIYPLKDNHLGFYRKPDSSYKFNYLKPAINSVELEKKYATKPIDSIVGVYYSLNGKNKAIIYEQWPKIFYLQNLNTGVVEAILNQTDPTRFEGIRFLNPPVPYLLYRNVRFRNGRIDDLGYRKVQGESFNELQKGIGNFEYKDLGEDIGYLRLSSFSANNDNVKKATDFFNETKSQIVASNLIVDVRNNGGGAYKTSQQFINFLKSYKGHVYILQNGFSVSNAEQFLIRLRGRKNITTLGETTKGMITYGSNYGKTIALPSGRFLFYPTDMNGRAEELKYENIGVDPDVKLDNRGGDWIIQVKEYIKRKM
ncbi:S41 family peptidase [Pedobacter sp. Du54]|uniref:S41 family peptidase n=1 Tax=Pedobacter anseongensis TaxID=3133439 RepID=UPI0030A70F59